LGFSMSKERTHFVVSVNGNYSKLFSARATSDSSLVLDLYHADLYQDVINPDSIFHNQKIKEQHYSIHTRDTQNSIKQNVIKHTVVFEKPYLDFLFQDYYYKNFDRHYTNAIKSNNGFAPLFCRLCPDLSIGYELKKKYLKDEIIKLCEYNPKQFTLVYHLFVASNQYSFFTLQKNVVQYLNSEFRIVIFWSLLPYNSNNKGNLIHSPTIGGLEMGVQNGIVNEDVSKYYDEIIIKQVDKKQRESSVFLSKYLSPFSDLEVLYK